MQTSERDTTYILVIGLCVGLLAGLVLGFIPLGIAAGLIVSSLLVRIQRRFKKHDAT